MESYEDLAINSLHVLDDTPAGEPRLGSAVFNGGINVTKNIKGCEIDTGLIRSVKGKFSDSLSVQHNIYTDGAILPLSTCSRAQLGCPSSKWNSVDTLVVNSQDMTSVNSTVRNSRIENLYLTCNIMNITDVTTENATYNIYMESAVNIVNLTSTYLGRIVTIRIPEAPDYNNHDYRKVIFSQDNQNIIKWYYNTSDYVLIEDKHQALDFVNVNGTWTLVNYNACSPTAIEKNKDSIEVLIAKNTDYDTKIGCLESKIDSLIQYNNFVPNNPNSEVSFMDFIDNTDELATDISGINNSLITMNTTISCLNATIGGIGTDLTHFKQQTHSQIVDLSLNSAITNNTIDVFKQITNSTFQSINTNLLMYDSKISGMALKVSGLELDVKKSQEYVDILDKRLCDHIANSDNKYKFLNDKMSHINDNLNRVMQRLNLC